MNAMTFVGAVAVYQTHRVDAFASRLAPTGFCVEGSLSWLTLFP
ncbi:hypothetical protein QFZ84_003775 [Pseudomonas fluorescens]